MGKSSGGIRNTRSKNKISNSSIKAIEQYSYEYNGATYTHKIEKNDYGVMRVFRYRNGIREQGSFDINAFIEGMNFNKLSKKEQQSTIKKEKYISSQSLLKSVNFENPKKSDYDKIKRAVLIDFKKRNSLSINGKNKFSFVKFEKNYSGTYDIIYNSPYQKNIRMTWNELKKQANNL